MLTLILNDMAHSDSECITIGGLVYSAKDNLFVYN